MFEVENLITVAFTFVTPKKYGNDSSYIGTLYSLYNVGKPTFSASDTENVENNGLSVTGCFQNQKNLNNKLLITAWLEAT